MKRRAFLLGALAAPVVIRTPSLLMPVKPVPKHVPILDYTSGFMVHWTNGTSTFFDGRDD